MSYYKLRKNFYKLRQNIITNYGSCITNYGKTLLRITTALLQITKMGHYKLRQLYQIIANRGSFWCYYNLRQVLQITTLFPLDETHLDALRRLILPRGFHPAHQQVELVRAMRLRSTRTNRSAYCLCQGLDSKLKNLD